MNAHSCRRFSGAVAAAALMLSLAACKEIESSATVGYHPSKLDARGSAGKPVVTFTPDGARRVGVQTATAIRRADQTVVPYAALIYDHDGTSWVYTTRAPLTFVRTQVEVDRVDGDFVLLERGVPPGTSVVTVGAAEVYGAELGIEGAH